MKIGNNIRDRKKVKEDNKRKVQSVKTTRVNDTMSKPLKTKVYGVPHFDLDSSRYEGSAERMHQQSVFSDAGKHLHKNNSFLDAHNFSTQAHSEVKTFEHSKISDAKQRQVLNFDPNLSQSQQDRHMNRFDTLLPANNQNTTFDSQYRSLKGLANM